MAVAGLLLASCLASAPHQRTSGAGTFAIVIEPGPYIGGSAIPIRTAGLSLEEPLFSILGPGEIAGPSYLTPVVRSPARATIIAATSNAVALHELQLVPPPDPRANLIAVATYYGGVVLHSPLDFHIVGIVPIAGAAGDVAIGSNGNLYIPSTDSTSLFVVSRAPWAVSEIGNVPFGNETVFDPTDDTLFVSNRDINGKGALTRVRGGRVDRVVTGVTAEGLLLDAATHTIYVGNINDDSVVEIDSRTLAIRRRLVSVPRTFGIALDARRRRLFVVSNQNVGMAGGGFVATIDLNAPRGRLVARSARLAFPLGAAFDPRTDTLFVSDEDTAQVYVLDARTLRPRRSPLQACAVPWRPHLDVVRRRLFVPCAHADRVAVFDVDRLHAVRGSPFATGRNPLGVATSS